MTILLREKLEPLPPRFEAVEAAPPEQERRRLVSRDASRTRLAIGTVIVALLLHLLLLALLLIDWQASTTPEIRPIEVTLRQEVPPPPPPPPPPQEKPPEPKPEVQKPPPPPPPPPPEPQPQPVEMKPRVSGPDEKTEAKKTDKPETDLPAAPVLQVPSSEEEKPPELPQPPAPKPVPPAERETATGKGEVKPLARVMPLPLPQRPAAPPMRSLTLHLPSQGGGTGEHDSAGDAYLNQLLKIIESHRLYPPGEAFEGTSIRVPVFGVVVEPTGAIVTITLLSGTGVPKLDEMARLMLTDSSPFPHLPGDYPQIRTSITIFIPVYPRR